MNETSTVTKIMMAVITAGVIAWAASITATVSSVTRLEPQIEQLQRNDQFQSEWIQSWPTEGELAADVQQTQRIEFLFSELAEALELIDAHEQRIRDLEIQTAIR